MARKKKTDSPEMETLTVSFSGDCKTVFLNGRLIRNGETVSAEEMATLVGMGVCK